MSDRYLLSGRRRKLPRHRIRSSLLPVFVFAIIFVFFSSILRFDIQPTVVSNQNLILTSPATKSVKGTALDPLHNTYGIAAGSSLTALSTAQMQSKVQNMSALGISWIRLDFNWSQIQPDSSSAYNWSTYDNIVSTVTAHHIKILSILDYTPYWARADACKNTAKCYPADPQQFATFATAVANRYSIYGLHDWEIWNEPNNPEFWQPGANAEQYTELLRATYVALKQSDPLSYVITGGLSPGSTTETSYKPTDFLNSIYADGAKGYFDAVAYHPYQLLIDENYDPASDWGQMAAPNNSLRSIMVANDESNKPIWITEFGVATGGPGPTALINNLNLDQNPSQADQAVQSLVMLNALALYKSYPWTGPFFWYTFQDSGTTQDTIENFFGLVDFYGNKKIAYSTYQNWIYSNK